MAPFLAAAVLAAAPGCLKTPEPEKRALYDGKTVRGREREVSSTDPHEAREMAEALRKLARESKESVPSLVRALGDDDEDARRVAASQLIVIGARDKSVIPHLVGALKDESERARGQAADALWTIAPAEEEDVPRLLRELASPAPDVRLRAAFALGRLRDDSSLLLPDIKDDDHRRRRAAEVAALAKALGDEDGHVRYYAALALSRRRGRETRPALERLRGVLTDEYAPTRAAAVSALGEIAYHVKADLDVRLIVRALIEALKDEAAPVRVAAVSALGSIASHLTLAETDLDARPLTEALTDEAAPVRVAAVSALGTIAADAVRRQTELDIRPLAQRLMEALTDKDALVRKQAAQDLEETGAKAAVPSLLRALKDGSEDVRAAAASALSEIVPDTPDAVGPLAEALEDSRVAETAADTLAKMGRAARSAIPALARALGNEDDYVRKCAAYALGEIAARNDAGDETLALNDAETGAVVSALVGVLGDDDKDVRSSAVWALTGIGPGAAPAVPALLARLRNKTGSTRLMLARAIEGITPGTEAATSALVASLGDEDDEVGTDAAWDLAKKGKKGLPLLTIALRDGNARARAAAAIGLGWLARKRTRSVGGFSDTPVGDEDETLARGLGRADVEAIVSALTAALGDADAKVRWYAAKALGYIGSAAASALPDIVRAAGDPEGKVRSSAVWALEGLGKKAASALPLVTGALKDPHEPVRVHAIMALEKIAP
ncbi:MAG: sister chromatid cohesion protein PDS5, partial [Planctomycetota bacterium]